MAGYGDDAAFTAWLAANGLALPAGAPSPAVLRQLGSAYLDATYGARFKGQPTAGFDQERSWPRTGAIVGGAEVPSTTIPLAIINASFYAAFQAASDPASLSTISSTSGVVKRERVEGAVEVEYQDASKSAGGVFDPYAPSAITPLLTIVDGMVAPYLVILVPGIGIWSIGC
ncbi:hypothetical protein FJ981_28040 [Mesorhizobium sp. B1-1-4]|uniref:DnaT-like ssDNA-binding protein n=1 Tax=Mesorhizobium sp. B1-1-4 TaxID=2589980 RepID=UPI00112BE401|nr:DnaT-like ssDNA-binding protein [Mesorhizobium sp. B1-1-4]TPN44449.1 hypothetical protein FJ981_28040 [Mesorhizobium sp. B1-1-4]